MSPSHDPGPAGQAWWPPRAAKARRHRASGRALLTLTAVLLPVITGWRLLACSTPVCQYALENWPADAYEVLVSSNGPVTTALKASCEGALGGSGAALPNASLRFLQDAALTAAEVRLTVRFPDRPEGQPPVWTGALSAERLRWIVDSPVRARLAEELVRGAAAVFLFLPCGDTAVDAAAGARLRAALEEMSRTLTWPPTVTDVPAAEAAPAAPPRFPILEVPNQDPAEGFLRAMLVASEADLAGLREPMAFPVFGRGRALYAIVGAGLNRDVVAEACAFVTGACSCQVKAQNPGVDLLLRADWDRAVGQTTPAFTELPPLAGLAASALDTPPTTAPAAAVALPKPAPAPARPLLARRATVVVVAALIAVLAGTVVLLATTRSR